MNGLRFRNIKVKPYKPGRSASDKYSNSIKLSANESALGVSVKVNNLLKKNLNISKYPDGKSILLRKKLAIKFKCNFNQIICGAGSDEVIQMLCQLFLKKKDEVIVTKFSFLMYRIYASIAGAKVVYSNEKNFKVSIQDILRKVNNKTKIVFIANPNNTTGTYLYKKELIQLRKKLRKNILLVLDDAYDEYMKDKKYQSALDIFKNKNNVFILRTFSKIYGLASLRVGWGYGDKKVIDGMYKIKPPFNVNKIAELCAIEALKDRNFISKSYKHNNIWANKIKKELENYNIKSNAVSANFLLLNFKNCKLKANNVEKKLFKKGIILRELKNYGINNCLRLTIGNKIENIIFLKNMKKIFNNV